MNVYRIEEEGETAFWRATNAQSASNLARTAWLVLEKDDRGDGFDTAAACLEYDASIFQSCILIGQLKN